MKPKTPSRGGGEAVTDLSAQIRLAAVKGERSQKKLDRNSGLFQKRYEYKVQFEFNKVQTKPAWIEGSDAGKRN